MGDYSGIIFMGVVWVAIIGLNVFCFTKIFGEKKDHIVGPLEIEAEIDENDTY